jgi:outer membrane protein
MFRFPHLLAPGFGAALLFSCSEKEQPREVEVPVDPAAVAPVPASPSPTAPAAGSGLKIATVDIQELFREYGRTNEAQKEINVERARIQKDSNDRLAHIRELDTELQGLRKELEDPSISESKRQTLFNEWSLKQEEGIALDRQRREDMQRRTRSLNEKMVQRMKGLLEEIRKRVEEKAKAEDYDYVFDKSGLSTTQLPFFLFTKGSTDMTRKLLADLNAGSSPPAKAEAGGSAGGDVVKPD